MSFISGETKSFGLGYMSLRGDLKVGRLKRGYLLLRAKGHFKGGPKTVDETMHIFHDFNRNSYFGRFLSGLVGLGHLCTREFKSLSKYI